MYGECWFTGKLYFKHGGSQKATLNPSPDTLTSGHLLCRDTISMYELFYHVNVPLMKGHLVDATADNIFWFSFLLRRTSSINFKKQSVEIFYLQNGGRQSNKSPPFQLTKHKQILPNLPNRVWIKKILAGYCVACFSVSPDNGNAC